MIICLWISITLIVLAKSFDEGAVILQAYGVPTDAIISKQDPLYAQYAVLPNYACSNQCPDIIIRPKSALIVSNAVQAIRSMNKTISVRGGGHGYTCQSTKSGGILLDMRAIDNITIDAASKTMTVGAGLTWSQILPKLRAVGMTAVHGQCTNVGVAGFSLHGGVHLGGLSELWGLSSDNILGLTVVVADGRVVDLNANSCFINGRVANYIEENCEGLWFALRGAGSSFAVVISLTIQLHILPPTFKSALSVLQLSISTASESTRSKLPANFLEEFLSAVPSSVSLTLLGLDSDYKAYMFLLKYASNRKEFISNGLSHLKVSASNIYKRFRDGKFSRKRKRADPNSIYFVVEATWIELEGGNSSVPQSLNSLKEKIHINGRVRTSVAADMPIPWVMTNEPWSIDSYDLVWGSGHAYGGASMITDRSGSRNALAAVLLRYSEILYQRVSVLPSPPLNASTYSCSDCVLVLHRVGEKLAYRSTKSQEYSSSVNRFRRNASLWIELDCGTFFRKMGSWLQCSQWVDETQIYLDRSVSADNRGHYPNVPNLASLNWTQSYYGDDGYRRLLLEKAHWDPENVFNHLQSIGSHNMVYEQPKNDSVCEAIYKKNANRFIKKALISFAVLFSFPTILTFTWTTIKKFLSVFYVNTKS